MQRLDWSNAAAVSPDRYAKNAKTDTWLGSIAAGEWNNLCSREDQGKISCVALTRWVGGLHAVERSRVFWNVRTRCGRGWVSAGGGQLRASLGLRSVVVTSASAMLSGKVDLGMHYAHMACQCIIARESLFLDTKCTANLLLARVVDSVLVTGQVIGPRKHGVAGFAGGRVDALTLVGSRLRVAFQNSRRRHGGAEICASMTLTLVLLEFLRSFKTLRAAMIRARIGARLGRCRCRLGHVAVRKNAVLASVRRLRFART